MLSNLVVTKQINAAPYGNLNAIFELPTRAYLPNMRLIDVAADVTSDQPVYYPTNTGVDALISNVLLYSGNSLIADCREFTRYSGYKNAQSGNAYQFSVLSVLKKTRQGTINKFAAGINQSVGFGAVRQTLRKRQAVKNEIQNADGYRGHVKLMDFLEFLNATPTLNYIPNLKLVVQWNKLTRAGTVDDPDAVGVDNYTIGRPTLVIEEIVDEKMLASIRPVMKVDYLNVEYDKISIAAVQDVPPGGPVLKSSLIPKGFDLKYLKDVVLAVQPSADTDIDLSGLARYVARTMENERLEITINGTQLFQQDGIDSPSVKMLFNKISRGALQRNLWHNIPYSINVDQVLDWDRLQYQEGHQGYYTVGIEDNIRRNGFQCVYRNDYSDNNADLNSAAQVHMHGRVKKSYVQNGNQVAVTF